MGSPNTHRHLVMDLVARTGAAVLFVNYTRSPEAQFPVPIQQAYAAVEWLHHADHAARLKLDPARVAFAGDSAGGAMAAAVNLLSLRQARHDLLPRGQVLFYPVTDLSRESCTYSTFKNGDFPDLLLSPLSRADRSRADGERRTGTVGSNAAVDDCSLRAQYGRPAQPTRLAAASIRR